MKGTYDLWLVALSMVVATVASYVALQLASHVTAAANRRTAWIWLLAGALSLGIGIWSMHFVGMLAFRLPIPMSYSIPVTVLSLVIAVVVSGFALDRVSGEALGPMRLLSGGLLMGIGIAAMHYTGMAAMQISPPIRYDGPLFALSIVIAVAASLAALWIGFQLRRESQLTAFWRKAGSAVLMGGAICGMYYTGMAAAIFAPHSAPTVSPQEIDNLWLAVAIAILTLLLLASTLVVSLVDAKRARDVGASKLAEHAAHAELAQTNEALRASQDQARSIIDSAMDAYIAMDAHSAILEWNRQAERTFGWSRAEVLGKNMAETIIPIRYRQAHLEGLERFLATGVGPMLNKRIEIQALHRDGHEFPVELAIWPVNAGQNYQFSALLRDISEQKRAHELLRRSEERRARAQRIARLGNWELEVATGKFSLSPEVLEIFGLDPADFGGSIEHFYAYVHPDDAAGVRAAAERSVRERVPLDVEYRVVRPDGETRVMHTLGTDVAEAEQRRIFSGTTQDVTERRAESRRLAHSEARLARAQRIAQVGSWEILFEHENARLNPVLWSDETYRIFGFEPGEVAIDSPTYFARVYPDDRERVRAAFGDLIAGVRDYSLDHRIVLRDGSLRHVHGEADLVRDAEGRPRRILGTVQDITARKRDELALRESEERYRNLVEGVDAIVWEADAQTFQFTFVSRRAEVMLGYPLAQWLKESTLWVDHLHPEDRGQAVSFCSAAVAQHKDHQFEYRALAADGRVVWLRDIVRVPVEPDGSVRRLRGLMVDITELRRANLERDTALANLERSNRELEDFAFVASHDLQEPLRKVQAFGGRLRDEFAAQLGERGGDYLERMTGAAVRMQRLIEDLLRYSRVASRSQPFESVELGRVAQEVLSDLETSIEAAQAAVELRSLPRIDADPIQMRQLFQNLIGNALKFRAAERPVRITVSATEAQRDGKPICRLEFRDNGIGFDSHYAENIFMPFNRLHERGQFEGSGIGLAIVRKIIERHGGRVRAESQPGVGSAFNVELPVRHADLPPPAVLATGSDETRDNGGIV